MSDVKQCDRCEEVFANQAWVHNPRINATVTEHTRGATAYSPTEYELCQNCAFDFFNEFMQVAESGPDAPEDRLDREHHNAPKDGNDDPVFEQ